MNWQPEIVFFKDKYLILDNNIFGFAIVSSKFKHRFETNL